jgi:hypothetical protein
MNLFSIRKGYATQMILVRHFYNLYNIMDADGGDFTENYMYKCRMAKA